jgi:DNA-binding NarL/FixJ family response regulator
MDVIVVDGQPLFGEALGHLLVDEAFEVIATTSCPEQALELAQHRRLDLAVIDVGIPLGRGVALAHQLKGVQPRCRILGLSMRDDPMMIASMIRAGADGLVSKTQSGVEIVAAVRSVLATERYVPPESALEVARLMECAEASPLERLTFREREVYELLVAGSSNDQVATRLVIARRTVETHRHRIMKKLEVSSVAQLVRLAFQLAAAPV